MSTFLLSSIPEHALVRLGALGEQMVRSRFFLVFRRVTNKTRVPRKSPCGQPK